MSRTRQKVANDPDDVYVDKTGITWTRPTAEAYAIACQALADCNRKLIEHTVVAQRLNQEPIKGKPKTSEAFQLWVDRIACVALRVICHSEYELSFNYPLIDHKDDDDHSRCRATVKIDSVYLWLTVTVYPACFESFDEGKYLQAGRDILHEVCHLVTEPLAREMMADAAPTQRGPYREIIERQTQRVCNIAEKAMPSGWYDPKKHEETLRDA